MDRRSRMKLRPVDLRRAASLTQTLVIAGLGGLVAEAAGLPVSWLLGPVLAVSAASLAGLDTRLPAILRTIAFFILGILAGSGVSPAVVEQFGLWPASFAIQMVGVVLIVVATSWLLRRGLGWDRETALFASLPGALAFVVAAAADTRADMRRVSVVQSMRLLFLIGALTPLLAALQSGEGASLSERGAGGSLADYGLLIGISAVAAGLGKVARVPGGLMLGALLGSAALHVGDVVEVSIPPILAIPSLVLLGAVIGERLRGIGLGAFVRLLPAAFASFAIGLALAAAAGLVAVATLGLDFGKVALAYAPGALEALTVLAYQFDVDPAYVAAHHVVRFMAIAFAVPFLARRVKSDRSLEKG